MPDIHPENIEIFELWNHVGTQWRAGGMGIIGLDYGEVRRWAVDLDIDLSICMWRKIRILENKELESQRKKEED